MMALITIKNELARAVYASQKPSHRGRPRSTSIAEIIDKIVYVCRTGCQWRSIDGHDGISCKTVYHWFRIWSHNRIFEHAFYKLSSTYRSLHQYPLIADTSYVKNIFGRNVIGANATDRGRKATKVSLLADSKAVPIALCFHQGNTSDFKSLTHLLQEAQRKTSLPLSNHKELYADKGYDSQTCRSACTVHGLQPNIPKRGSPSVWGGVRIAVEVCFGHIDKFRRCILRYDASIAHFKSFHYLACSFLVARA